MLSVLSLALLVAGSVGRRAGNNNGNNGNKGNKQVVEEPEIFDVPKSMQKVVLPQVENTGTHTQFEVPDNVREQLEKDPEEYLTGACLKTYQGYSDGTRLRDLVQLLGDEAYDMIVEYAMYDYLKNRADCNWIYDAWGTVHADWQYVSKEATLQSLKTKGSLIDEVSGWFDWWLEEESKKGNALYTDDEIAWKVTIANEFVKLKKTKDMKVRDPNSPGRGHNLKKLLCDRVDPVHFFQKKPHFSSYQQEKFDMDGSDTWLDSLVEFIERKERSDISGPSTKSHDAEPTGFTATLTLVVEVCHGVCMKVGTGISWNAITEDENIHWTYGLGALDQYSPGSEVRAQLAFYCESTINWGDVYHVGYPTHDDYLYTLMYTPDYKDFVGIAFEVGYFTKYHVPETREPKFAWFHNRRIAKRLNVEVKDKKSRHVVNDDGGRRIFAKTKSSGGSAPVESTSSGFVQNFGYFLLALAAVFGVYYLYKRYSHHCKGRAEEYIPLLNRV